MTRLLFCLISVVSCLAFAQTDEEVCAIEGAVRCPCKASMMVSCPDFPQGSFIDNEQKVDKVTIEVNGTTYTLENPQQKVRAYYALQYNDEVKNFLKQKGVTVTNDTKFGETHFYAKRSDLKLFKDANENESLTPQDPNLCQWKSQSQTGGLFSTSSRAMLFQTDDAACKAASRG